MNKEKLNIENLFQENFKDLQVEPSDDLWNNIEQKLWWQEFFSFQIFSFNIFYLTAILISFTSFYFLNEQNEIAQDLENIEKIELCQEIKNDVSIKNIEINKTKNTINQKGKINIINNNVTKNEIKNEKITITNLDLQKDKNQSKKFAWEKTENELVNIDFKDKKIDSEHFKIYVPLPKPQAKYKLSKNNGCMPLEVKFTNLSINADTYLWNIGEVSENKNAEFSFIFKKSGIYPISLKAKGRGGISIICTDTIIVFDKPEIIIEKEELDQQTVRFLNYSNHATNYVWTFSDNKKSNLTEPTHFYELSTNYFAKVKAISEHQCEDSLIISDIFKEKNLRVLKFPNAFTANLEGSNNGFYTAKSKENSIFYPIMYNYNLVKEYHLQIFNRSKELIYESKSINIGWDGYCFDRLAQQGTYIWRVKGKFDNGQAFFKQGSVTLFHKNY